jgi:hypothetical protein
MLPNVIYISSLQKHVITVYVPKEKNEVEFWLKKDFLSSCGG